MKNELSAESIESDIHKAWQDPGLLKHPRTRKAVAAAIDGLDCGKFRVAEQIGDSWRVNIWLKKSVLLYFKLTDMKIYSHGNHLCWDKIPLKFENWTEKDFVASAVRVVPGAVVRKGAFIDQNVILMPSFVNIGARVGEGSMIDTWSTVGSCAQIGKRVHLSGGAGIGGVLEPIQAEPVIIEDDCFIGARSEVAEGVRIGKGSVLSMGVFLSASTRIYNRITDEVFYGAVPPYSVVVPGSMPGSGKSKALLGCAVIVKQTDEVTRSKTAINDLLREN